MKRLLPFVGVVGLLLGLCACDRVSAGRIADEDLRWEPVRSIPIGPRAGHSTVWTGDEILLWGGGPQVGMGSAEGTAFEPSNREWTSMEEAPVEGRWFHSAVWTGEEMIVWGGRQPGLYNDGAAYDPESDMWRVIAESPLRARSNHIAMWTGEEMIVYGGHISPDNNDYIGDAAAYNPNTDSWRQLPESGLSDRMDPSAVWTGNQLVIWGGVNTNGWLNDGAIYDPATDAWQSMAESPLDPRQNAAAVLDGDSIVIAGGVHNADSFEVPAARYDLKTDAWEPLREAPTSSDWPLTAGDAVALFPASTTLLLDGELVEVPALPTPPQFGGAATYTGDELVVLGGEIAQDTPSDLAFVLRVRN